MKDLSAFTPESVGAGIGEPPWVAHVTTADLDGDGLLDILACEAKAHHVIWIRQRAPGVFEEKVIGADF